MTSNPMLSPKVVENVILDDKPMTISGSINKTLILLSLVFIAGAYTWNICLSGLADKANLMLIFGIIAGFILCLITTFKPQVAKITSPAYALCEGLALGTISFQYGALYDGIVMNAVGITLLALFSMLLLYKLRILQATPTFRKVIIISTLAIAVFYLIGIIGAFIGHPMTVFNGSIEGIVISLVICAIAALNFILDFDFIERGSQNMLPSYFEWYGAFGLLVTLVWLYVEILRLLAQLNRRN